MALTQAQRNAKARLARFNKTHGSKIKLLRSKTKEKELNSLVEQNKGKEARALLKHYDQERLRTRREADRKRRQAKKRTLAQQAIDNFLTQVQGRNHDPDTIERNVTSLMTTGEQRYATTASYDDIVSRARRPPTVQHEGENINPFWYH